MIKTPNPAVPPTVIEKEKESRTDFLSEKERKHDLFIKNRMTIARDERNAPRDEFDGMGYLTAYDRDTKSSIAYISPAKNKGENEISTGTSRQALIALVARAISYNFETEFSPFGKENDLLAEVARGLETAVDHANYLDGDDEQAKERANELFAHGDVVVYEDWVTRWGWEKSRPKFDGKVTGVTWTKKKAKIFEGCERRTVQGRRFYFGDIFTPSIDKQPFCFEVNHIPYADAAAKYGEWERFKYVKGGEDNITFDSSAFGEDWRLETTEGDNLEEVIYVDVPNNEMQITLGGVPMLPIGFPMKWDHGRYPWAHQGAEPIRSGFIYHRSFIRTLLNMQDLENDMWRVLIMLAWKAAIPPMANNTGQVVTRRNLMAGEINDGINADQLKPILDGSLANTGFVDSVLQKIRDNMTGRSVPEIKQGLGQQGLNTATETVQVQKEAEVAISLNLSAVAGIKSKADVLRASNIMQFAFSNDYSASAERPWKGGVARWVVEAVDRPADSKTILDMQEMMSKKEGRDVRLVQIRKDAGKGIDRLEGKAVSKPKQSSSLDRLELAQMFQAAAALFGDMLDPTLFENLFRSAYRIPGNVRLTRDLETQPQLQPQQGRSPKAKPPQPAVGSGLANTSPV
jgi:hypothetical protein